MKSAYKLSLSALILPLLLLTACQQNDTEVMTEDASADSIQQDITSFQNELQSELQQVDNELSEVEQSLAQATEEVRTELESEISELRQERQEIDQNLQELGQETTDAWQDTRSDLRRRIDALAVDVSRARMKAADTVDEFKSIAQEELSEIDTKMTAYQSEQPADDMATMDDDDMATSDDGMDEDMAQDEPMPNAEDQRVDPSSPGIGDAPMTGTDNDMVEWQEERQELAQDLEELDASAEDEFEDRKEELADAIADLNAEVRQAVTRLTEGSDIVQAEY